MLLSIGLMVKNESKHLEQCLQSLTPILNELDSELIIVDTGSTDNTVEIARKYTEKVYHHEWFDDFSGMRNIVLRYAKGKWFFYLDGDEVVEDDASGIIRFFKSKEQKKYNSAFMDMKNFYSSDATAGYGLFQALRFFRNDKDFHFKGIIHEQPQAKGPVAKIDGRIIHYGYLSDDPELMEYKFQRNVALISKVLEKEPDNIYHLFQLSRSYSMYGKNKQALEPIEKAYKLAKADGLSNHMNVVIHLASLLFRNQRFSECEAICQEGIALKDGYMDLYYHLAMAQTELGKYEEAIANFQKHLTLIDKYEQGDIVIDLTLAHHTVRHSEQVYLTLCAIYEKLGDYDQVIYYGNKVTSSSLARDAMKYLVNMYFQKGCNEKLKQLYDSWSHDDNVRLTIEGIIEGKQLDFALDEQKELARLFAEEDTPYGLLNIARIYFYDQEVGITDQALQKIGSLDLQKFGFYYGDILLARIKSQMPLLEVLSKMQSSKITGFFMYLIHRHKEFLNILKDLLDEEDSSLHDDQKQTEVLRIKAAILYAALQQGKNIGDDDYNRYFRMYVDVGIAYIEALYNVNILDMQGVSWARTNADGFLFTMRKAQPKNKNSVEYVRYLREALAYDETMKRGIDFFLKEVQEELANPELDELNELKKSVQATIKEAINAGELETAVALINEYEDTVGIDAPLCSAKGIIYMIDGQLEEAEKVFLSGLELEPDNADLLYNLGYVYEATGNTRNSLDYYSKALRHVDARSFEENIKEALARIRVAQKMGHSHVQVPGDIISTVEDQILSLQNALIRGRR